MRLEIYKTLWGHTGSYAEAAAQAREAGFDGFEGAVPPVEQVPELAAVLHENRLAYIAEVCTAGSYVPDRRASVGEHLASLENALARVAPLAPRFVNCIGGCDAWPLDRSLAFFEGALALGERYGLTISFETHRSRSLYNPWTTLAVLERLPSLRLTCDFSHWCVVCERLLDSEPDVLERVAAHAHHIHARVGYDQGPQVPDPAAPEYAAALAAHQRWWEMIWQAQHLRDVVVTTLTPEFGPDGYLHELPYTRAPVADLWNINRWIARIERAHFRQFLVRAESA